MVEAKPADSQEIRSIWLLAGRTPGTGHGKAVETEGSENQDQPWSNKLGDASRLAAVPAILGEIMACGYAMGAFGAGMRVHAWVPIINAGVITLILGINRLWGFAGTGLAFGVAGGSVISVWASELFMGGDPAMGVVIAVMAVGIVLGMPAMAACSGK